MPYEVAELENFRVVSRDRQWRIVEESSLTLRDSSQYGFCLFQLSKTGWRGIVSSLSCSRIQNEGILVLRQQERKQTGEITAETFFRLLRGNTAECADAMEGVNTFLKILLSQGDVSLTVNILQDLIKPYGPITVGELVDVAIKWDLGSCMDHERLKRYVAGKQLKRGRTVLQCAIEEGKENVTRKLMSIAEESEFHTMDNEENTVVHLAAKSGRRGTCRAVLHDYNPVKNFIRKRSSTLDLDPSNITGKLNFHNTVGDTPLAIAAKNGHFAVTLTLLLVDANPNVANYTSGCTPLHFAASGGYTDIVKALLVFGAKPNLKNNEGKTPADLATNHPKVLECFSKMKEALNSDEPFDDKNIESNGDGPFLLCMDGGGIRGLATCMILREIEDRVRKQDPNFVSLASYFDYVTGTSIGSYIAFSLAYGRLEIKDIIKLFFHFKDEILTNRRPFPHDVVDKSLKDLFTEDTLMSDVSEPKVIALTCKADVSPPILHIMRNTGKPRNGEKGPDELKVWEAARASSAAPTYFPPFGKFIDGGILANNPTVDCIGEVIDDLVAEGKEPRLGLVVSVGTCSTPRSKSGDINIHSITRPADIVDAAIGVKNFLLLVLDQMTFSGGSQVDRSKSWCASMNCPFFRLDPTLDTQIDLAENDERVLVNLMFESLLCAKREYNRINAVTRILLSRPPRMSERDCVFR